MTFTKVFKGKAGEGQYGAWQLYECYTDALGWEKTKLSFFETIGKIAIIPKQGMAAIVVELKEVQKGGYTNYTITKIVPVEPKATPQPKLPPTQQPKEQRNNYEEKPSFYISYAKDIAIVLIEKDLPIERLPEICDVVVEAGLAMLDKIVFNPKQTKQEINKLSQADDPYGDDLTPTEVFDDEGPF